MWIEIQRVKQLLNDRGMSRPARALWIEIIDFYANSCYPVVEAREGLVD